MSKEVEKIGNTAVEEFRGQSGQGTEGLGTDDVRPPRLVLAQSNHPQVKKGNAKYIQGLSEGDLFNDLTGAILPLPLEVVIVQFLGRRAIEFYPMDGPGPHGVKDFNVPFYGKNDPRTDPRAKFGPNGEKPAATVFYEYLVYLPQTGEIASLSLKGTQLKVATTLNSLLKYPITINGEMITSPPAWARTYLLGSASQQKDQYQWSNYTLSQRGVTDPAVRKIAADLFESFKAKTVVIPVEDEGDAADEPTPF